MHARAACIVIYRPDQTPVIESNYLAIAILLAIQLLYLSMQWGSFNISLFVHITYIKEKYCMDQNYNTMHCVITIAT